METGIESGTEKIAEVMKPVDFEMYRTQDKIIDRQKKEKGTVIVGWLYLIFAVISGYLMIVNPDINFLTIFFTMVGMGAYYVAYRKEGTLRITAAVFMIVSGLLALILFVVGTVFYIDILICSWLPILFASFSLLGGIFTIKRSNSHIALLGAFFCIFLTYLMGLLALLILIIVHDEFYD